MDTSISWHGKGRSSRQTRRFVIFAENTLAPLPSGPRAAGTEWQRDEIVLLGRNFSSGPLFGTGAVPTGKGDFLDIAIALLPRPAADTGARAGRSARPSSSASSP